MFLYLQYINAAQSKVPAYLGGVSIFLCLTFAVVSLGLALSIVPRQVMPWTGLLLMYEWTFTFFFFLFGGFLHLVNQWGKRMALQAGSFSSHTESLNYDSGKGTIVWRRLCTEFGIQCRTYAH